jgi:RHS repeat-associated protein
VDHNRDYAQVIKETNGTDSIDYLYGDDLIRQSRNGTESYYLYDGLGSTRALADSSGTVTDRYDYEAFGQPLNRTGTTDNSYLFTGEQYDSNLDNYYLRARYYDPDLGGFTQMDTFPGFVEDPLTLNAYIYTKDDPVNNTDPSGKFLAGLSASQSIVAILTVSSAVAVLHGSKDGDAPSGGFGPINTLDTYILWTQLYHELIYNIILSRDDGSDKGLSESEEAQKDAEYQVMFRLTRMPPEPGNDCSSLSKNIHHTEAVLKRYKAWDAKWAPGRHAEKIQGYENRLKKLKAKHKKYCT